MDSQALVPDNDELNIFTEEIAQQEDDIQNAELERDKRVIALQQDPGWQQFAERLDYYIEFFRTGNFMGDIADMTKEEIGEKYIIGSTVAGICEELKGIMTGAVQSVVEDDAKRKAAAEQQQSAQ